jgi:hypothetical protein
MNQVQAAQFETVARFSDYICEGTGIGRTAWPMHPKLEPADANVDELFRRVKFHVDRSSTEEDGMGIRHSHLDALRAHSDALRNLLAAPEPTPCRECGHTHGPRAVAVEAPPSAPTMTAGIDQAKVAIVWRLSEALRELGHGGEVPVVPKPRTGNDAELRALFVVAEKLLELTRYQVTGSYRPPLVAAVREFKTAHPHLFPSPVVMRVSDPIIEQARQREIADRERKLAEAAGMAEAEAAVADAPKPKKTKAA